VQGGLRGIDFIRVFCSILAPVTAEKPIRPLNAVLC
jgi:hypothetical protein